MPGTALPTKLSNSRDKSGDYLRAYQRQLRARPSDLQRSAMEAAAYAAAKYDRALRDPNLSATSLAHYERVHRKSLAAMHASFKRSPAPELTLEQILHSQRRADHDA